MQIHILQKALTIVDEYKIAINDRVKFIARDEGIGTYLYSTSNQLILCIFKTWNIFLPNYNIVIHAEHIANNKKPLKFRTLSYFKNTFSCTWGDDLYKIYVHKGLKYSIFKNEKQIAGISQDRWTSFKEDGFRLECDSDCQKEFIIAIAMILDSVYIRNIRGLHGLINYNVGVMFEAKPFNENWKPS